MFHPHEQQHVVGKACFCSRCRAFRTQRYMDDPKIKELSDKLRAARVKSLGNEDPRCRMDEVIRVVISQIDKK
jgi:hypothetical protein